MGTTSKLSHCPSAKAGDSGTPHTASVQWCVIGKKQAMFSLHSNCLLCEAEDKDAVPAFLRRLDALFAQNQQQPLRQKKKYASRGGRPKNDPRCVRHMTIGVRVNEQEKVALHHKATSMGMTIAEWLRTAALQRKVPSPPIPPINRALYGELARLGVNINQLVRRANSGFLPLDTNLLLDLCHAITRLQRDIITPEDNKSNAS